MALLAGDSPWPAGGDDLLHPDAIRRPSRQRRLTFARVPSMRDCIRLLLPLFVVFMAGFGGADHASEWLMSTAQTETTLAGIVVGVTRVGEAVRRLGSLSQAGRYRSQSRKSSA